jgi:hypothetical protein
MTWRILPSHCNHDANSKNATFNKDMPSYEPLLALKTTNSLKSCSIEVRAIQGVAPPRGETIYLLKLSISLHHFLSTECFNACYSIVLNID